MNNFAMTLASAATVVFLLASAKANSNSAFLKVESVADDNRGSNITLNVTITNTTARKITVVKSNPGCDFAAQVEDGQGRPAEFTEVGRDLAYCKGRILMGRWIEVTLKPGESTKERYPIYLFYDLQRPGKYTVKLGRKVPKRENMGLSWSNEVTLVLSK